MNFNSDQDETILTLSPSHCTLVSSYRFFLLLEEVAGVVEETDTFVPDAGVLSGIGVTVNGGSPLTEPLSSAASVPMSIAVSMFSPSFGPEFDSVASTRETKRTTLWL